MSTHTKTLSKYTMCPLLYIKNPNKRDMIHAQVNNCIYDKIALSFLLAFMSHMCFSYGFKFYNCQDKESICLNFIAFQVFTAFFITLCEIICNSI